MTCRKLYVVCLETESGLEILPGKFGLKTGHPTPEGATQLLNVYKTQLRKECVDIYEVPNLNRLVSMGEVSEPQVLTCQASL